MNLFTKLSKKLHILDCSRGYTCDLCSKELFHYPRKRICPSCEDKLMRNDDRICFKCGRKTLADGICLTCKRLPPQFERGFSPYVYVGNSASAVNQLKNGKTRLAAYLGEEMADYFLSYYERRNLFSEQVGELTFLLVPVPTSKQKRRERGYNQAELLAWNVERRLLERGYRAQVCEDMLKKRGELPQQKHLHYMERIQNAAKSYSVAKRKTCKNQIVLLIDDILTTGATSGECARKLYSAGAASVLFLCAASRSEQR